MSEDDTRRPNRRLVFTPQDRYLPLPWAVLRRNEELLKSMGLEEDPFWSPPISPAKLPAGPNKHTRDEAGSSTDLTISQQIPGAKNCATLTDHSAPAYILRSPVTDCTPSSRLADIADNQDEVRIDRTEHHNEQDTLHRDLSSDAPSCGHPTSFYPIPNSNPTVDVDDQPFDNRASIAGLPGSNFETDFDHTHTAPLARQISRLLLDEVSSDIGDAGHYKNTAAPISLAIANLTIEEPFVLGASLSHRLESTDPDILDHHERTAPSAVPGKRPIFYKSPSDIDEPEHHKDLKPIIAQAPASKLMTSILENKMGRSLKKRSVALGHQMAIFIHAGAGYHSIQNEHVHLTMCSMAASDAMEVLKAGGTAVDAVAAAIKVLEDKEVTNSGYGSNLTIDGKVECDATIVDHYGRSGACGAVSNIKNPIYLAKLILSTSTKTLSLRRVPPNLLVGEGAMLFAKEHGMAIVSNSALVSRNANDRYQKWRDDLIRSGTAAGTGTLLTPPGQQSAVRVEDPTHDQDQGEDPLTPRAKTQSGLLRDHASALLTGTWNEGQPDSPDGAPDNINRISQPKTRLPLEGSSNFSKRKCSASASSFKRAKILKSEEPRIGDASDDVTSLDGPSGDLDTTRAGSMSAARMDATELTAEPTNDDYDLITDTMGAIAIDSLGNIAAGSSSGGIGMKHMGRTGPAALVGIGTAVVPCDRDDPEKKRTAAVTSGTGEHMATTMAAQKCAERLYHSTRRGPGGGDIRDYDTCAVMKSFVDKDFMGHPGVCNMPSASAIGVMGVEVTVDGIYVHWAHNTDSFALASMGDGDEEPVCVMSRLAKGHGVTVGARKIPPPRNRS